MMKQKNVFFNILQISKKYNTDTLFTFEFRPFPMSLEIELRRILFPLIILEMF
jgi:hypothetical protein